MRFNPKIHHRRSIRLRGYDYRAPGAYFFTSCVLRRECLFGDVRSGEMHCNAFGQAVWETWKVQTAHYPHVVLDEFIVMPNHIHGIVVLVPGGYSSWEERHPFTEVVRSLKSFSAMRVNDIRTSAGKSLWQRDYYEHIIRNERELERIRAYIRNNPLQWEMDRNNPRKTRTKKAKGWSET